MELAETIDTINKQLRAEYGVDTVTGREIYRVVWSEDQFEKRLSDHTPSGIQLLIPEVIEFPKYKQWLREKYILERLSYVPDAHEEMTVQKISYEPIWTFVDNKFNYLPPRFEVCKIVIDAIHAAIHRDHSLARYKDDKAGSLEETQQRVTVLQQELFGNETEVGDALAHGEAVIVPRNYEKVK